MKRVQSVADVATTLAVARHELRACLSSTMPCAIYSSLGLFTWLVFAVLGLNRHCGLSLQ